MTIDWLKDIVTGEEFYPITHEDAVMDSSGNTLSIKLGSFALSGHSHGNISSGGTIQSVGINIGNGDTLIVADSSNGNKIEKTSITFDGTSRYKALTQKGTFEEFQGPLLYVDINYDDDGDVPGGTFNSINNAVVSGRDVVVRYTNENDEILYFTLSEDPYTNGYDGYFGFVNQQYTALRKIDIYDDDSLSINQYNFAQNTHAHGLITSAGTITNTGVTIASGDKLVITDASNSNRITRLSTAFDGSTATKALTQKGTFEYFQEQTLYVNINYDDNGNVPQGTYQSIVNARNSGRDVLVRYTDEEDSVWHFRMADDDDYNQVDTYFYFINVFSNEIKGITIDGNDTFQFSETYLSPYNHSHGYITNDGKLQTSDITIANGDKLVVTDASESHFVKRASISFDGSTTTQALTKKGTFAPFQAPLVSGTNIKTINGVSLLDSGDLIINAYNTLREEPYSFIKNVHYDSTSGNMSYTSSVWMYSGSTQTSGMTDQPLPIPLPAGGLFLSNNVHYRFSRLIESTEAYNLIPGKRYYYDDGTGTKQFDIERTRRFIKALPMRNVRDLGGIETDYGSYIKYGRIIRGSEMRGQYVNASNDELKVLYQSQHGIGVTMDLDLRGINENPTYVMPQQYVRYVNVPLFTFGEIKDGGFTDSEKSSVCVAFNNLVNEVTSGGCVYVHCAIGCHRAGFFSALIEGALGVRQCEIDKDYELSTFSVYGPVQRSDNAYVRGMSVLNEIYDGSWELLLLDCGVSRDTLKRFRKAMIVDYNGLDDEVVYQNVTYKELVKLRNNESLIPGSKYRMIDYVTETEREAYFAACSSIPDLPVCISQQLPFDLVLTATSKKELDCNVKAVQSKMDTNGHFSNTPLWKWELKYDLDNDKNKYSWAPYAENGAIQGKGVIYYMKDEFGNELPYDFKNILFYVNGSYFPTFSGNLTARNVVVKPWIENGTQHLNQNIFFNTTTTSAQTVENVLLKENAHNNTAYGNCFNLVIGINSNNNELGNVECCSIGDDCVNITCSKCNYLYIGNRCFNLTLTRPNSTYTLVDDFVDNKTLTLTTSKNHICTDFDEYIGGPVANINTILDSINGEVI